MALKLTISKAMIEAVMTEWERENPGRRMSSKEFSDRMMEKIEASAEIIHVQPPHSFKQ